jgi:protein phosphatase 1 regulatory subunit 7
MATIFRDGFKFIQISDGGEPSLQIESERLHDCIAYINSNEIKSLHISSVHGYQLDNVDFLTDCPNVEQVSMDDLPHLNGIYGLGNLSRLYLEGNKIDFSRLDKLLDLRTFDNPSLCYAENLRRLFVYGHKAENGTLSAVKRMKHLESLEFSKANIRSLAGIDALQHLKSLELHYCSQLEDISDLACLAHSLEFFIVDTAKKMANVGAAVQKLDKLKSLRLNACAPLPDLEFIRELPALEDFVFRNTNVLSGDLTPCLKLRFAAFTQKPHFSHRQAEIHRLLEQNASKPVWQFSP